MQYQLQFYVNTDIERGPYQVLLSPKMPCRRRPLPVELVNEFVSFVPGPFCRKFVLPANSQFLHLLLRSKRSKIWKNESMNVREQTVLYAYGQVSPLFYAIIPRVPAHRDLTDLLLQMTTLPGHLLFGHLLPLFEFWLPTDGLSRWIISLRARNVPDSRAAIWGYFNDNSNALASRFRCSFQMVQLNAPSVEWDVALVTFADRSLLRNSWNALSSTIHTALIRMESGEVPPAVDPTPHDNPSTDSPPSLGGL
ncbi:hypothetical protein niasHT_013396 [Heterodera trifolii]|uniref:Uncharacterized protein n=1 Tax=Heterodera trifolii TaxID=157864 RepID=A0ABD2LD61_9BILA